MNSNQRWTLEDIRNEVAKWTGETDRDPAAERKRLRIVQAATELFLRQGYRKTSVDEIARHAGIAKGTVYLYSRTKGDLLLQAIVEEKRAWAGEIAALLSDDVPGRERLKRYVRGSILLCVRMPLTSRLLRDDRDFLTAMDQMDPDERAKTDRQRIALTGEILREALAPATLPQEVLEERARALIVVLTSLLMADERVRADLPLERYADQAADILVDGLCHVPGPHPGGTP